MRRFVLLLALAVIATGTAHAEQAPSAELSPGRPFALALNTPLAWNWSVAASAWVGWDDHHAIRANFARYRGPLWRIIPAMFESDGDYEEGMSELDFGHTTDLSLGWVYYPRRVLDGAMVEVGLLCRLNRLRDQINDHDVADEERHTNEYSGRILVGWTWRLSDWWFLATGVGAALGYERGREKTFVGYDVSGGTVTDITKNARVSRFDAWVEAYLRIGMAFGQ